MNGLYVVAGSTGAIGRHLCHAIKSKGGTPLLLGRSADSLSSLNSELGGDCPMIPDCDFSDPTSTGKKLASDLKGETLRGLAYAVGSITLKPLRGCKPADFATSFDLNVVGAAELIKAALPGLKKGGKESNDPSSVVLFSSIAARRGLSNHSVVASSKAAVEGLAVSLAAELAPAVRVNCVAPSLTAGGSKMASSMVSNVKIAEAVAAKHPLARLGKPEDSALAAAYLLSPESSWVTGVIMGVDGGRGTILS